MPKSEPPTPAVEAGPIEDKPKDEKPKEENLTEEEAKDEKAKDDKPKEEMPKDVKSEISTEKKETLKAPEQPAGRPITPTGERGKSKTTGKTISGWI